MKLIDKDALIAEIERRRRDWRYGSSIEAKFKREECDDILSFLDTLEVKEVEEEPVSEEFEEALAKEWKGYNDRGAATVDALEDNTQELTFAKGFYRGAKWQKEKLWKRADGDDLPEIDRGVIVFTQPYPLGGNEYVVSFAHRPNPNGWDGKSVITGKTVHYTPKTYGVGGWNIPNIVYWLDVELPKKIEL